MDKEEEWRDERCLFFELGQDRAARCGCDKYLELHDLDQTVSSTYGAGFNSNYSIDSQNLFDMCDGGASYVTLRSNNRERADANKLDSNTCKVILELHPQYILFC